MIRLTKKPPDIIIMEIKMHLPQMDIINYLQKIGYEIKAFSYVIPASDEMLINESAVQVSSFTATKANEQPSESNLYLTVFESEIKNQLKKIS